MTQSSSPVTVQRTRWLQFSVRTLLLVVAVLSVWLGLRVNAARRQRAAVIAIQQLGGTVCYDYQIKRDGTGRNVVYPKTPFPYPEWLRPLAEAVAPPTVVSVRLRDTAATDRDLELLKSLRYVRDLDLANTRISDDGLVIVGQLRRLRSLTFLGPQIGDHGVAHLKRLQLEQLSLWKTNVTDAGVGHLRDMRTLRNLVLDETQITDAALEHLGQLTSLEEWLGLTHTHVTDAGLTHLTQLKKLKNLNLIGTNVSRDGLEQLRKALPETNVSPY